MDFNLKDLERWNNKIEKVAKDFGLDYYPQEFEIITYKDMLAYEAYLGMPSRYSHWSFGKAYEKNRALYSVNLTGLPYEMVINSNPCIAYLMKDNTDLLQILTMAHVYGHNDFFKNNRLFKEGTRADTVLEMFKLDGEIIKGYINDPNIGYKKVEKILDAAHTIRFQIPRVVGEKKISQEEIKKNILEDYNKSIENKGILDYGNLIKEPDLSKVPLEPDDDLMQFLIDYGNLEEWEKSVLKIVRRESLYFIPQIETKIMNEGWASFCHYNILKKLELSQGLYFEFLKRHNDVIAPVIGSLNPYYLGFKIFENIHEKYGLEKALEVRALERDSSFLRKYLTEELCRELNLFQYGKKTYDYVVEEIADEIGWKKIRDNLILQCGISAVPYIRVENLNIKNNTLTLEHIFDGRELEINYCKETLKYIQRLWGNKVRLITKNLNGEKIYITCDDKNRILIN